MKQSHAYKHIRFKSVKQSAAALQSQFGLDKHLSFRDVGGGFVVLEINNAICSASIALQGAQVMTWQPKTQAEPVLWISEAASLKQGKSIRGGIPVCWPWFGAHPTQPSFAAHGIARTAMWDVKQTSINKQGEVQITLSLQSKQHPQWQHDTLAELKVVVGEALLLNLTTTNLGDIPITIGQALHTYFKVGDVREVSVHGLADCPYIDKLSSDTVQQKQQGNTSISSEVDRIYLDNGQDVLLEDGSLQRTVRIQKQGSSSTIVWNPWIDKTKALGDMGADDAYLGMLCIESANADEDVITLSAKGKHTLSVCYSIV
ncbi:MAG TPA: D-hexose-6-phosphate mutarotase [Ghiorsea sp.]|nr:D-hexose-6-phosphate mutarotase [Ghiorsea sp.]HIP07430.1 D-hexose-6-phosphate mutarotase [Mariprofundaceae bacterium]